MFKPCISPRLVKQSLLCGLALAAFSVNAAQAQSFREADTYEYRSVVMLSEGGQNSVILQSTSASGEGGGVLSFLSNEVDETRGQHRIKVKKLRTCDTSAGDADCSSIDDEITVSFVLPNEALVPGLHELPTEGEAFFVTGGNLISSAETGTLECAAWDAAFLQIQSISLYEDGNLKDMNAAIVARCGETVAIDGEPANERAAAKVADSYLFAAVTQFSLPEVTAETPDTDPEDPTTPAPQTKAQFCGALKSFFTCVFADYNADFDSRTFAGTLDNQLPGDCRAVYKVGEANSIMTERCVAADVAVTLAEGEYAFPEQEEAEEEEEAAPAAN